MRIYLAGPIDLAGPDGQSWKKLLQGELKRHYDSVGQMTTFDPAAPWGLFDDFAHDEARCKWIEEVNTAAVLSCDIMVALFQSSKASFGTPIELDMAYTHNKIIYGLLDFPYTKAVYVRNRIPAGRVVIKAQDSDVAAWMVIAAQTIVADLLNMKADVCA